MKNYLLLAKGIGKVIQFDPQAEWQEYADVQIDYAGKVNAQPYEVEMYELNPNQQYNGIYWDEQLTERGVIFKVLVPNNVQNLVELADYLKANRDVLAINYTYYQPAN